MVVTPGREGTAAGQEGEEEGDEAEEEHSVARRPELVPGFGAVVQVFGNLPKQTNATQVLSTAGYQEPGAETGERDTHRHQEEVSAADSGPQHGVAAPRPAHPGLLSVTAHICHEPADQVVLTAGTGTVCRCVQVYAGVCRCVHQYNLCWVRAATRPAGCLLPTAGKAMLQTGCTTAVQAVLYSVQCTLSHRLGCPR